MHCPEVVGLGGLEPPASPLSGVRSNHLSYRPVVCLLARCVTSPPNLRWARGGGGADRDRTGDPLLAKQVLSQLSYSPGCPAVAKATQRSRSGCSPAQRFFWLQVSCVGALRRLITLKEVIQPHLPIRLPCYDFTPVMNHTVVGVLLAVRLPASGAAHSHGVTGGVYKARERIHRGMADPRLLAIPTSWSRVADSNPD